MNSCKYYRLYMGGKFVGEFKDKSVVKHLVTIFLRGEDLSTTSFLIQEVIKCYPPLIN